MPNQLAATFVECGDCPAPQQDEYAVSPCDSCAATGQLVEPIEINLPPLSVLYRLISWELGDKSLPKHLDLLLNEVKKDVEEYWADLAASEAERKNND